MLNNVLELFTIKSTALNIRYLVKLHIVFLSEYSCVFSLQEDVDQVTLYSYKVQSTITSRMASTVIQARVVNNSPQPQSAVFDVQIPKGAFISNFSM